MKHPAWASTRAARKWLIAGAVILLFLSGRAATRSFGVQTTLSDGARAMATCKAPWRSARVAPPAERFTLWVMTGGTGKLRDEGIAALGARCRMRARRRMAFATLLLAGSAACAWLALPARPLPAGHHDDGP